MAAVYVASETLTIVEFEELRMRSKRLAEIASIWS